MLRGVPPFTRAHLVDIIETELVDMVVASDAEARREKDEVADMEAKLRKDETEYTDTRSLLKILRSKSVRLVTPAYLIDWF